MFQSRTIDLSNYSADDLILKGIQGSIISISTEGSPSVIVKGKNSEIESEFTLAIINLSTLTKTDSISGAGIFAVPCPGVETIKLQVSGSGKIKIKELS